MAQDTSPQNAALPDATSGGGDRVEVRHSKAQERYEAYLGDEYIGYLDYVDETEQVVVTHTVIADRHTGRGYGGQLVRHVLDDLAIAGKPVVPVCPFVSRFVDENPSYSSMIVQISR